MMGWVDEVVVGLVATAIVAGVVKAHTTLRTFWNLPDDVQALREDVTYVRERVDDLTVAIISGRD